MTGIMGGLTVLGHPDLSFDSICRWSCHMNSPAYFEIQADDPERAIGFYTAVFGWGFTKVGSGREFVDERILGGFLKDDEFGLGDRHALGLEQ